MPFQHLLADRTAGMAANAIREILKVAGQPGVISLAGGVPSVDSFPMEIIRELTTRVLDTHGSGAFQYDLTEGFLPLRKALVPHLAVQGIQATPETLHITSGSQGVLDATAKLLISKGDRIAVESPTYLGALSAFNPYEPAYVCLETDDQGLIPASLEAALRTENLKFIYLVPTFQNPTGRTLPLERRQAVAELLKRYNALLLEDDPYSALRYEGEALPPIKSMAPDHVIYASTLSKVFAPGLRIGFYAAPDGIRQWLAKVKQGVDLHTATLNQALAAEYLNTGSLERHLPRIIDLYAPRKVALEAALERELPPGFTLSPCQGGMFLWLTGPKGFDAQALYHRAVANGVAFVPGDFFYPKSGEGMGTLRLNFTMAHEGELAEGARRLALSIREEMEAQQKERVKVPVVS